LKDQIKVVPAVEIGSHVEEVIDVDKTVTDEEGEEVKGFDQSPTLQWARKSEIFSSFVGLGGKEGGVRLSSRFSQLGGKFGWEPAPNRRFLRPNHSPSKRHSKPPLTHA
jgi:hypothetical protein